MRSDSKKLLEINKIPKGKAGISRGIWLSSIVHQTTRKALKNIEKRYKAKVHVVYLIANKQKEEKNQTKKKRKTEEREKERE